MDANPQTPKPLFFAFNSARALGNSIASHTGIPLSPLEERDFEGGEHKSRPLVAVRNKWVFLLNSLHADEHHSVNDKLVKTLLLAGTLKDQGATRLILLLPYICYSRKDRRTKQFDPVNTRYVAQLFESMGVDQVVTLDVHNLQAFQNAFRINTGHLQAAGLFADYFTENMAGRELTVLSPDSGGVKRADHFRKILQLKTNREILLGMSEKFRSNDVVSGQTLAGDVKNRDVIIYDDMISSGTSLLKAAELCKDKGAEKIYAASTHALFSPSASAKLNSHLLEKIVVTNSIFPITINPEVLKRKIVVLDQGQQFGNAIVKIFQGEAIESSEEREIGN